MKKSLLLVFSLPSIFCVTIFCVTIFCVAAAASPAPQDNQPAGALDQKSLARIYKEVRHQFVLLPYYNVFDNLAYKVDPDGTVTLLGQVVNPTLKSDAENAVKSVEGVEKVFNNIDVLPNSPHDDRIRRATYRAIYGNPQLSQYQLRAVPPIHIIVKNGNITLEGAVSTEMDKTLAGMKANGVSGAFSVTNNLVVDEPPKKDDKKKKWLPGWASPEFALCEFARPRFTLRRSAARNSAPEQSTIKYVLRPKQVLRPRPEANRAGSYAHPSGAAGSVPY